MRYSAIHFRANDNPLFHDGFCYRDGNGMILTAGTRTANWDIVSIDNETDIFFTTHWMAIPETHPYYNYGLLINRTKEDIKLGMEELIHVAVRKLYTLTKARAELV